MKTLLTAKELALRLNVAQSTIRKWSHLGYLPILRLGRTVRFDAAEIDNWLTTRSTQGRKRIRPTD